MTKPIKYLLATFLLLPFFSFAQQVKNVHFEQEGKQVYIYYDLHGTNTYNVTIYCSEDNGNTWGNPLQEVSGDVGIGIKPGNNKKVIWNVLNERTKLTGNVKFKIQVESFVFVDPRDGQRYKAVKIGNQIWMAKNLNYKTNNSWCYDNNPDNCEVYGRLYTWEAAMKACPGDWHLPSDEEWKTMEMALGMSQSETDEGKKMKSSNGWNKNGNGTNSSGFNALPGGYRYDDGSFSSLGDYGYWWSSSEYSGTYAWYRYLYYDNGQVYRYHYYRTYGFSVRCLKN